MFRNAIIITLFLAVAVSAHSTTIEECRSLAEANYPLVQRYDLLRQTQQFTLSNIARGWLPQISAYGQGTAQNAVPEWPEALQGMLSAQGYDVKGISPVQYRAGIDVQQTLYDGGAISAARQAQRAQTAVEMAKNGVDIYALRRRVEDVCFSWLLVEERLKQNGELQKLLSSSVDKLQALHDEGLALSADVDAVRAELVTARQQAVELQSARTSLQRVLSLLCGCEVEQVDKPSAALDHSYNIIMHTGSQISRGGSSFLSSGYNSASASSNTAQASPAFSDADGRPEYRLFDAQLSLYDAQERSLRAACMPKLGLFAQGYYGYTGFNMFHDMLYRDPSFNAIVGARLTWNISSLYTRRTDQRRLQAQRRDVEAQRATFAFNQNLQATSEQQNIVRYANLLSDDDEIIRLRHNVRLAAEARLDGGVIDTNGLLQEINRENQAIINRSVHEIEHLKAIYEYNNTLGQ